MQRQTIGSVFVVLTLSALTVGTLWGAGLGGTIESVAAESGTLVLKVGKEEKEYTLEVDGQTKITVDGKSASLAELKAGLRAFITTSDDKATKIVARSDPAAPATAKDPTPPRKDPPARKEPPAPRKDRLARRAETSPSPGSSSASRASGPELWPQFRGPNRDGVSKETGLLASWPPQGPPLVWTARGLGEGYSSVSIADGKVLTMGNQGDREAILALDAATGKPLWMAPCGPAYEEQRGNGPRSVPTVDGDLVYAVGAHGDLTCAELAGGKVRWQVNILQQFGGGNIKWGISESVLVDGDRVVCTPGGRGGTLAALNKLTGRPIWTAPTPSGDEAGYASAIVAEVGGVRQYIQFTGGGTVGVRAGDGAFLWEDRTSSCGTANCSAPVFFENCVFTASGYGTGGALLKLASSAGRTTATVVYQTRNMKNHHGGMVQVDGYLYGSDDPGILTCLDLKTGNVMWQERSVGKGSVTYADGHLYLRSERGPLALVEANPKEYRETGRFEQPDRSDNEAWAYPVVAGGRLYLRDGDLLLCYNVKSPL